MDLGLSDNPFESFRLFQEMIQNEYNGMADDFDLYRIDATESLVQQQRRMRQAVEPHLTGVHQGRRRRPGGGAVGVRSERPVHAGALSAVTERKLKFYGEPPLRTDEGSFPGRLIVFEGPDGSGRSTHIRLTKEMAGRPRLRRGRHRSYQIEARRQGNRAGQDRA